MSSSKIAGKAKFQNNPWLLRKLTQITIMYSFWKINFTDSFTKTLS